MTAVLAAIGLIILMTGCGEEASAETPEPVTEASIEVAEAAAEAPEDIIDLENTVCPVMGLEVMEGQYIDWEGFRIHFCCAGCDDTFLAAPEDYLSVLAQDEDVAAKLGENSAIHAPDGIDEAALCSACGETECVCDGAHEVCSACGETECICGH